MTSCARGITPSLTPSGGIDGLLEGRLAEAPVGGEERFVGAGAQLQVPCHHLLHRIDDAVRIEARAGDGGQGRILRARAAEQELVVLLAALLDAQDADVADVMMPAGIDAAGDLD